MDILRSLTVDKCIFSLYLLDVTSKIKKMSKSMNQFDFVGSSYFVQYFISSCACAGSILLYFLLLFDGLGKLLEHSEKLKTKKKSLLYCERTNHSQP